MYRHILKFGKNVAQVYSALTENLARACAGLWVEALLFLDFFVYFFCPRLTGRAKRKKVKARPAGGQS